MSIFLGVGGGIYPIQGFEKFGLIEIFWSWIYKTYCYQLTLFSGAKNQKK